MIPNDAAAPTWMQLPNAKKKDHPRPLQARTSSRQGQRKKAQDLHKLVWLLAVVILYLQLCHSGLINLAVVGRQLGSKLNDANAEPTEKKKRTAVVWATLGVTTPCEVSRIMDLVKTAGMDVWVLHGFHILQERGRSEEIAISKDYLRAIPGLKRWPQSPHQFAEFDWAAGSAKSSFLRFLVKHSEEYDFAWLVEDDVYFAGSWDELLSFGDNTTDFMTSSISRKKAPLRDQLKGCQLFDQNCSKTQVGWELARVSSRLAQSLLQDLEDGHIRGHHESIIASYTKMKNYTYGLMDKATPRLKDGIFSIPKQAEFIHRLKCGDYFEGADDDTPLQLTDTAKSNLLTLLNAQN